MRYIKNLLMLLLLLYELLTFAQVTAQQIPLDPAIRFGKLANGLQYFIQQHKNPEHQVALRLVVNVGSVQENFDQQGFAHFIQHMNFSALENFTQNDIRQYLQGFGIAAGADVNATTGFEATIYRLPILSSDKLLLDKGFSLLADWSHNALLNKFDIEMERKRLLQEIRLDSGADNRMMKQFLPALFPGSIYANRLPLGKADILRSCRQEQLKQFHRDWYRPNNEAVIVAGDIDPDEAEQLIITKFANFKNAVPLKQRRRITGLAPRKISTAMIVTDKEALQTRIELSGSPIKNLPIPDTGGYKTMLTKMLFNNLLAQRFNHANNSALAPFAEVSAQIADVLVSGWEGFNCQVVCDNSQIRAAVEMLVITCMQIKKNGFTAAELKKAKASLLDSYKRSVPDLKKISSTIKADELVQHYITTLPLPGKAWEYARIKILLPSITLGEVNEWIRAVDINNKYFALVTAKQDTVLPKNDELAGWINAALLQPADTYLGK